MAVEFVDETRHMTRLAEELRGVSLRTEGPDEESLVMQSCLESLSPDEREILMLAGWEGLNAAEIGRRAWLLTDRRTHSSSPCPCSIEVRDGGARTASETRRGLRT